MERRGIHEQQPRATGEFSHMVVKLLPVTSLGMHQNDIDGVFATEKVADSAVRNHVGLTLEYIQERGKGSGHVWDNLRKRTQGIKSKGRYFQEGQAKKDVRQVLAHLGKVNPYMAFVTEEGKGIAGCHCHQSEGQQGPWGRALCLAFIARKEEKKKNSRHRYMQELVDQNPFWEHKAKKWFQTSISLRSSKTSNSKENIDTNYPDIMRSGLDWW